MESVELAEPGALLVARENRTVEHVLVACAAAGTRAQVVRDVEQVRSLWAGAPVVLVGIEMAAQVAALGVGARPGVYLVGTDLAGLLAWSVPLEASVLHLPDQAGLLASILGRGRETAGSASVAALTSGSPGAGATTVACALAQAAVTQGRRTAVVDLDPLGGGIDLVFGAETAPGWRWPELAGATGHVDDLSTQLVQVDGVHLVSAGRTLVTPPPQAVRAVVASLSRSHDLVLLDGGVDGAHLPVAAFPELRHLLVVSADVRSVMAARSRVESNGWRGLELVVRTGPGRRVAPELVAESLGLPLLATIADDKRIRRASEVAEPPGRGRRGAARQVAALLKQVAA